MTTFKLLKLFFLLAIFNFNTVVQAQNWPCWRGPNGDGTSQETNLPVEWDAVKNVIWKSEVPGVGYSSPIVWEDKLFTLTALKETQEKVLLCYDAKTGKLLWQKTVIKSPFEAKHNDNSFASGTPATDGKLIYVAFLDGQEVVVAAYDFSGKQIWIQRPGKYYSPHGFSCSPALFENKVIINGDGISEAFFTPTSRKSEAFLCALNRDDGDIMWSVPHDTAHSFSTPIFRKMDGKMQMIFCGNKEIASYNPDDGSKYWYVRGPWEDFCSSPVYNEKNDLLLISSAWPQRHLLAIKPDGQGDVTESKVVWRTTKGAYYVPSPVCTDNYLFSTMTNGEVHCIEVATGKTVWTENLGKQYSSPVLANGLVYMPNDEGVITVIKPGTEFKMIAQNSIGERMNASPAISNGKIYLRGDKHLFCIGLK